MWAYCYDFEKSNAIITNHSTPFDVENQENMPSANSDWWMSELEIEFQSEIKSQSHLELFHSIRPMQVGFPIDIYLPYMNIISRMSDVVEFWPHTQVNQVIQSNLEIRNVLIANNLVLVNFFCLPTHPCFGKKLNSA